MARRSLFRQRDISAAVKAMTKAGLEIARVEVDQHGKIALYTGATDAPDDLDRELAEFESRHA